MTDTTRERLPIAMLAACVAVEVLVYYFSAFTIVDHDPLVMGEIARRIVDGEALYRESWDNKPPLALLFYAPAQMVAPMSYMAQQLFGALWTGAQALLAFALLRDESTRVRSVAASLVLLLPLSRTDFVWASSEDAVNLFTLALTLIAYRIARRGAWHAWELRLAGALAVFAFHCRQPGVLFAVPAGMFVLFGPEPAREKARAMAALASGALAGIVLMLAVVLLLSDVPSYVDAVFIGPQRFVGAQLVSARWVVREHLLLLRHHPYMPMMVFALLVAAGRRERLLLAAVAVVSIIAVLAPLHPYSHYQEQLVPLLVLSAAVAVRALEGVSRRAASAYGATLVAFYVLNAVLTAGLLHRDDGEVAELESVVEVIGAENAKAPGSVLAIGRHSAYVYFRTRVTPVHKYHWDQLFDAGDFVPQPPAEIVREIIERPPTWLVIDAATLATHRETPGETRKGQLVHALCGVRICGEVARTENWHVLRVY